MKNIKDMVITNCNVKNSRRVHDLPTSVNDKVISLFVRVLFRQNLASAKFRINKTLMKIL